MFRAIFGILVGIGAVAVVRSGLIPFNIQEALVFAVGYLVATR